MLYWGEETEHETNGKYRAHETTDSLMDTVLLANVRRACRSALETDQPVATLCEETEAAILARRNTFPIQRSLDVDRGRLIDLPDTQ